MPSTAALTTIGFDADDTLWQNETFFRITEDKMSALLSEHAEKDHIVERLLAAERRNLQFYGYGVKGFTLSMIETAIEVTDEKVPAAVLHEILHLGRDTLEELTSSYQLVLVTKGDLFDQERKLAQSGLGELFDAVEIVSEKNPQTYQRIFSQHGEAPGQSMMVGNSLKSDILPAIAAGSWGVHVPHDLTWSLEQAEAPTAEPLFRQIPHLGDLPKLITDLP